jgi:uncharacterized membrane protein YhhN
MESKNHLLKNNLIYGILLIPVVSAILALITHHFAFKAGVAASGILILAGMFFTGHRSYEKVWLIIAAFLFSIAGDWFLSNKEGQSWMFMAGIALFFFAHVCYLMYALKNGKINANYLLGFLTGYLILFFLWLTPGIAGTGMKAAALIYLVISCISLSAAIGINQLPRQAKYCFVAGISLILFSDTIIAFKEFTLFQALNFLILPTYYLAQVCITFALIVTMRTQGLDHKK